MKKTLLTISFFLTTICFHTFAQSITSVYPNQANAGQTLTVDITGQNTHFVQGSYTAVEFDFTQCSGTTNWLTVNSSTSITANITIPSFVVNGTFDVGVYEPSDGYIYKDKCFQVNSSYPSVSLNPSSGLPGQTLNVNITGTATHFTQTSGTLDGDLFQDMCFTPSIYFSPGAASSDTYAMLPLTIPLSADTGYYDLILSSEPWLYPNVFHVGALTNVNELNNAGSVEVSPSICSSYFDVKINSPHRTDAHVEIYDVTGRKVLAKSLGMLAGNNTTRFYGSDFWSRGSIYFVCVFLDDRKFVEKVIMLE